MDSHLPAPLRSLVHHVKLNETGWWEDATRQLVIAGLYELGGRGEPREVVDALKNSLGIGMDADQVTVKLDELVAAGRVVQRNETGFTLTQDEIEDFEGKLDALSDAQAECRRNFERIYRQVVGEDCGDAEWSKFTSQLLLPVVKHYGAELYDLVTATGLPGNEPLPEEILAAYPADMQEKVRR